MLERWAQEMPPTGRAGWFADRMFAAVGARCEEPSIDELGDALDDQLDRLGRRCETLAIRVTMKRFQDRDGRASATFRQSFDLAAPETPEAIVRYLEKQIPIEWIARADRR